MSDAYLYPPDPDGYPDEQEEPEEKPPHGFMSRRESRAFYERHPMPKPPEKNEQKEPK